MWYREEEGSLWVWGCCFGLWALGSGLGLGLGLGLGEVLLLLLAPHLIGGFVKKK